ncbi:MAG: NAD(P)-binding protein [Candidatus Hodarchaeales archaeon]
MPEELPNFSNKPAVIGAGLGGLLTGALLAKKGLKPVIFEKLAFAGGRFTSHDYRGYAVPTGAVHMLPFGVNGSVARILRDDLDLGINLHPTDRFTSWYWADERKDRYHQKYLAIVKAFSSLKDKKQIIKLIMRKRGFSRSSLSMNDYLKGINAGKKVNDFFKAIAGFALSLNLDEILAKDMYGFLEKQFRLGRPAIPSEGCKGVTEKLMAYIKSHGGNIFLNSPVSRIEIQEEGKNLFKVINLAVSVKNSEEIEFKPEFVVSNVGQKLTGELLNGLDFLSTFDGIFLPAGGFGLVFGLEKPVLGHTSITMTPGNESLCGVIEPTHAEPSLAPPNHHIFISHHPILPRMTLARNIELGRQEIHELFPRLDKVGTELTVHSFHSDWPVNRLRQGYNLPNKEESCDNLFFVGDGNRSRGDIMTEGVAGGVLKVVDMIRQDQ